MKPQLCRLDAFANKYWNNNSFYLCWVPCVTIIRWQCDFYTYLKCCHNVHQFYGFSLFSWSSSMWRNYFSCSTESSDGFLHPVSEYSFHCILKPSSIELYCWACLEGTIAAVRSDGWIPVCSCVNAVSFCVARKKLVPLIWIDWWYEIWKPAAFALLFDACLSFQGIKSASVGSEVKKEKFVTSELICILFPPHSHFTAFTCQLVPLHALAALSQSLLSARWQPVSSAARLLRHLFLIGSFVQWMQIRFFQRPSRLSRLSGSPSPSSLLACALLFCPATPPQPADFSLNLLFPSTHLFSALLLILSQV